MLSRPVIKMNITCGVENSFNRGKNKENACWEMSQHPLPVLPLLRLLSHLFLVFSFNPSFWSATVPERTPALRR